MTATAETPDAWARGGGRPPVDRLAATGLAAMLCTPALLHALRGNLHNVALLAQLLQKDAAGSPDSETLGASVPNRAATIRAEVVAMQERLRWLESLFGGADPREAAVCDLSAALDAVLKLARVEAARRSVAISATTLPSPVPILCAPQAFHQVLLTCSIYAIRRCGQGSTMVVSALREAEEACVAFRTPVPATGADAADHMMQLDLLDALAGAAGGRLSAHPAIAIAFRTVAR